METRTVSTIAREIKTDWKKPYFGAVPYLDAMFDIQHLGDKYMFERGDNVVRGFLANAGTWRGENAKRIKAELKAMLGMKK